MLKGLQMYHHFYNVVFQTQKKKKKKKMKKMKKNPINVIKILQMPVARYINK